MWFGIHLVRRGVISSEQLFEAVEVRASRRPPLGELAVRSGKMTMKQVFLALSWQAETQASFGQIAREMRMLTKRQLADLLLAQAEQTPSLAETLVDMGMVPQETVELELAAARDHKLDHCLPIGTKGRPSAKNTTEKSQSHGKQEPVACANEVSEQRA